MVHDAKHRCLKHLCLYQRRLHYDYRLFRERYFAFFHRIYVAGEFHGGQVFAKFGIFVPGKEFFKKTFRHVAEAVDHLNDFICPAYHRPVVVFWCSTVKQVENGAPFGIPAFKE